MITHVGSINIDYIVHNKRLPVLGETTFGESLTVNMGGKGAIQIGAASRLGAKTCFLSMVGEQDSNLELVKSDLAWAGVSFERVGVAPGMKCGSAFVLVDADGNNSIIIVNAADRMITPAYIEQNRDAIEQSKVVMTEFMVPMDTCECAMKLAKQSGAITLVNPAPRSDIPDSFFPWIDVITPNETEAAGYCGFPVEDEQSAREACAFFHHKGVQSVVLTLGARGAFVSSGKETLMVDACPVRAVDTAGAGDAFNGALAFALWKGCDLFTAARFANAAASIGVQRKGSYRSIPAWEDVEKVFRLP